MLRTQEEQHQPLLHIPWGAWHRSLDPWAGKGHGVATHKDPQWSGTKPGSGQRERVSAVPLPVFQALLGTGPGAQPAPIPECQEQAWPGGGGVGGASRGACHLPQH